MPMKPCLFKCTDAQYAPPTPTDLKELRELYKLTQIDVAKITGVSWNAKGSSTVAKWETDQGKADHRQIPYSAWRLLLVTLWVVQVKTPHSR